MALHPFLKILITIASGFLLSLSAPGYDFSFLAWIFLSPLFTIIINSKKLNEAVLHAFLFGFAYNLSCLHWVFSLHPLTWLGLSVKESYFVCVFSLIFVVVYSSLYFVIFAVVVSVFRSFLPTPYNRGFSSLLLITFFWLIIFNKLGSNSFLLGFPWTLVEYSQYKNLYLIQIAEYFGSIWISFLIIFFNLTLANLLIYFLGRQKIGSRYLPNDPGLLNTVFQGFLFFAALILFSLFFGMSSVKNTSETFSSGSEFVSILQGNLPTKTSRGKNPDIVISRKTYTNLLSNVHERIIIAPEGSLPTVFIRDPATQYWLKTKTREKQSTLLFGTYCNDSKLTNCAVSFLDKPNKFLFYEKERLVPFGEYIPFYFLLPKPLKKFVDHAIGEGFSKGKQISPLETTHGKIGVNICFELIFPEIVRKRTLTGANFLVNLSDLSWFSSSLVKKQFIAFGVFRAIENRKPVVIATNSGISVFIDKSGRIKSQTKPDTESLLTDFINPNNKITFYARYGW